MTVRRILTLLCILALTALPARAMHHIYHPHGLKQKDSHLKVAVGDAAPDFELPALEGGSVRLSDYRGRKNVVLSFVPAAWTPVCSDQWPGYNAALELFEKYDAVVLGISVDNIPSQFAWVEEMGGLDFPVLSDFWPHGEVAAKYGVLRTDGTADRALIVIDKQGVIRFTRVGEIDKRPDLGVLMEALEKLAE